MLRGLDVVALRPNNRSQVAQRHRHPCVCQWARTQALEYAATLFEDCDAFGRIPEQPCSLAKIREHARQFQIVTQFSPACGGLLLA